MNTNKLKTFSKEARLILIEDIKQRIAYWGFDKKGNILHEVIPIEGGYVFRENVFNDPTVPKKWNKLKAAINRHSVEDIVEEAAYTWFNRLIAIKILVKNHFIDSIYEYVSDQLKDPAILHRARKGELSNLRIDEKKILNEYIIANKDEEAFALLITAFCHGQKLTNRIFGHIDDYTELLLPNNLLSGGGIIEHINSTNAITDEDYKQVELIGWLYQFYISDKKDEVFAGFKNKKKARPEDIPAATQIFTPKWIVKYMVENTVGRVWLDLHPDSQILTEMKYFVEPAEKERYKPEPIIKSVTDITLMDPACGSGHILVEGFDLLLKMYLEEGYSTKNAIESIIKNNLFGLDIDDRAAQLTNFAVLIKAAKYYPDLLKNDILSNIYSFPEERDLSQAEVNLFLDKDGIKYAPKLKEIIDLVQQGKNLGSVIKIDITTEMCQFVLQRYHHFEDLFIKDELDLAEAAFWINLRTFIQVIILLSGKYTSVVTNPPYMGQKNMNDKLKEYINNNYPISKYDLFSVFMEVCWNLLSEKTFMSMINQQSWMFLSSYEKLRSNLIGHHNIESMLHLGPGAFEEISGEVVQSTAFILRKGIKNSTGIYHRLLSGSNKEKEDNFIKRKFMYENISQSNYLKIPSSPIVYWISPKYIAIISNNKKINDFAECKSGMSTSDNKRFIRYWYEISYNSFGTNYENSLAALKSNKKWFPYNKGGNYKKWYGNNELVINWKNDGEEIKIAVVENPNDPGTTHWSRRIYNTEYFFNEGLTWSKVSSDGFSVRLLDKGFISDVGGCSMYFLKNKNLLHYTLGSINSKLNKLFINKPRRS